MYNDKIQLNFSCKVNPETQSVYERSTLVNVRCQTVEEAVELYQQLKARLGGEVIISQHDELQQIDGIPNRPSTQLVPAKPQQSDLGNCPNCSTRLIRIVCRKPNSKNYLKAYAVCPKHRITGCSHIVELAA